jgi:hypothetical protein
MGYSNNSTYCMLGSVSFPERLGLQFSLCEIYNAAIFELAQIGPQAIETDVEPIGVAALGGL